MKNTATHADAHSGTTPAGIPASFAPLHELVSEVLGTELLEFNGPTAILDPNREYRGFDKDTIVGHIAPQPPVTIEPMGVTYANGKLHLSGDALQPFLPVSVETLRADGTPQYMALSTAVRVAARGLMVAHKVPGLIDLSTSRIFVPTEPIPLNGEGTIQGLLFTPDLREGRSRHSLWSARRRRQEEEDDRELRGGTN